MGIDKIWRKRVIKLLSHIQKPYILDVATGTGDLALLAHKKLGSKVTGVDISTGMLEVAEKKIKEILGRIEEIILGYHYEHLKNCLAEVAGVFRLEKPYNDQLNFNVHPKDDSIRRRVRSKWTNSS